MLCYYGDDMEEYRRWENNIKMDLKEIGVDVMNWMELAQDRGYWRALWSSMIMRVQNLRIDGRYKS